MSSLASKITRRAETANLALDIPARQTGLLVRARTWGRKRLIIEFFGGSESQP